MPNTLQMFRLEFAAKDLAICVGTKIGTEFDNVAADGNGRLGLDDVRLAPK